MLKKITQKNNYNVWCTISKVSLEYHPYFSKFKEHKCKKDIKFLMNPEQDNWVYQIQYVC